MPRPGSAVHLPLSTLKTSNTVALNLGISATTFIWLASSIILGVKSSLVDSKSSSFTRLEASADTYMKRFICTAPGKKPMTLSSFLDTVLIQI